MKASDLNIARLKIENEEKDREIIRKTRILEVLRQKSLRIEKQKEAV
jgi:hypothetical protein